MDDFEKISFKISVPRNASKAEEIGVIQKLRDHFVSTGTYLESLFSQRLVNWCSEQIKNDFPPDPIEFLGVDREEKARLERDLNKTREDLNKTRENARLELKARTDEALALKAELEEIREAFNQWKSEKENEVSMLEIENGKLVDSLETSSRTIRDLKAEAYDLMAKIVRLEKGGR